jgi:polyhydroxybutyrate depolymerase
MAPVSTTASTGTEAAEPATTASADGGSTTVATTSAPTTTRAPDCTGLTPLATSDRTFAQGDLVRTYHLSLPRAYDNSWAAPLIVNLPGYGATAAQHDAITSMSKVAKRDGFIVVTPDATGDPPSWNVRGDTNRPDDVAFFAGLMTELGTILCVESDQVFIVGHANGGRFAATVACAVPVFTAIAMVSVSTAPETDCGAQVQPAVLEIAGTADATNPYEGDDKQPGAQAAVAAWAEHDGCTGDPTTADVTDGVQSMQYAGCAVGTVTLLTVTGGANPWPGSSVAAAFPGNSEAGKTFDATGAVVDFFDALVDPH